MNLKVILNSEGVTSTEGNTITIGQDYVKKTGTQQQWYFDALNYAQILKSELEFKNRTIYRKIGVKVNSTPERFPTHVDRYTIYSDCSEFTSFGYVYSIKMLNFLEWYCDSVTFDMVSNISKQLYDRVCKTDHFLKDKWGITRLLGNLNIKSESI